MENGLVWLGSLLSILIRWLVSLYPHSGQSKPPMYGDYEAQRHWMEITMHVPVNDWYRNTSNNDLLYWGLDYPPLTAYHSYINGLIAHYINPAWVALGTSRGFESYHHKLFMRYTVLVADLLIFLPSVILFFKNSAIHERIKGCAAVSTLLYPGLILIDHGHFQYNCVSLGLLIWTVVFLERDRHLLASVAFSLAINYKQMELYHALPVFCYLLGKCWHGNSYANRIFKLAKLSLVVTAIFTVCWLPFLNDLSVASQVMKRIFPFDRGLYEDKVANVWFSLSIIVKWKQLLSVSTLVRISTVTTLLLMLPSSINLLGNPSLTRFKFALINSSLIFFLCSFQVHEKSILLAAIPTCLMFPMHPLLCFWFLLTTIFSMFPLFLKDNLVIAFYATLVIYSFIMWRAFIREDFNKNHVQSPWTRYLFVSSMLTFFGLTLAALLVTPPLKYPDLHSVLSSVYSCLNLIPFSAYFHWLQFKCADGHDAKKYLYVPSSKQKAS